MKTHAPFFLFTSPHVRAHLSHLFFSFNDEQWQTAAPTPTDPTNATL